MHIRNKVLKDLSGFFSTIGWCLALSWKTSKLYTVLRMGVEILNPLLVIALSYVGKYLLDLLAGVRAAQNAASELILLLGLLLAFSLLRAGGQRALQYCQSMHDDLISGRISLIMMERSLSADLEHYDNPEYYDKLQSANRDAYAISGILWSAIGCVSACISALAAFTALGRANLFYGLIMLGAAVPASFAAARYTKLIYRLSLEQINGQRRMGYCQGIASDRSYAQDIRLYGAGGRLKERYKRIWDNLFRQRKGMARRRSALVGLLDCLPEIALVAIGADVAFKILGGSGTVGDYSLYSGLAGQLRSAIVMFSFAATQIYDNRLKIENFKSLGSFKNRVADSGQARLERVESIEFDNVRFTYPGAKTPALSGVNFFIGREERVAFVGLNGSGKSTLIKLLLRLYDPDEGVIRINGKDAREYALAELRKNFSVYFQDMRNYCFTLKENFEFADEGRGDTEEAAIEALKGAACEDILAKASKGLDTSLTRHFDPDGIELSGGQHQKLALARTFFRSHTALVLDEPSANLDPKAEHDIFNTLKTLSAGKITLFTSHRLSNAALAGRIIVLESGRVVEDGTQEALLKNKQRYAELFRYQQERYMVKDSTC